MNKFGYLEKQELFEKLDIGRFESYDDTLGIALDDIYDICEDIENRMRELYSGIFSDLSEFVEYDNTYFDIDGESFEKFEKLFNYSSFDVRKIYEDFRFGLDEELSSDDESCYATNVYELLKFRIDLVFALNYAILDGEDAKPKFKTYFDFIDDILGCGMIDADSFFASFRVFIDKMKFFVWYYRSGLFAIKKSPHLQNQKFINGLDLRCLRDIIDEEQIELIETIKIKLEVQRRCVNGDLRLGDILVFLLSNDFISEKAKEIEEYFMKKIRIKSSSRKDLSNGIEKAINSLNDTVWNEVRDSLVDGGGGYVY